MINEIKNLDAEKAKKILVEIMTTYLEKGFGLMNKTDIETLFYDKFKKNGLLSGKCYPDSFKLKITEAKARKLIYESQVKYGTNERAKMEQFLRQRIGDCLSHANFVKNDKEVRFAIEDKYTRIALLAKLRENNFFADTSFNKDIISLNESTFTELISLLVPNDIKPTVLKKIESIIQKPTQESKVKTITKEIIKKSFEKGAVDGIRTIGKILLAFL